MAILFAIEAALKSARHIKVLGNVVEFPGLASTGTILVGNNLVTIVGD